MTCCLFKTVTDLARDAEPLRRARYGVIEMSAGHLRRVRLRPWPKLVSQVECRFLGGWQHRHLSDDRCWLYYSQPWRCPSYLMLNYVVSSQGGTLESFHGALVVLDEIARLKNVDATICHVANPRISPRLLKRWGWEPLSSSRRKRQYIKRFYGTFPANEGLSRHLAAWDPAQTDLVAASCR